jgi:hypothetical protein
VRSTTNKGVLSDIVRCARCGGALWFMRGGPEHTYHFYYCSARRDLKMCDAPNSRAPICDALAIAVLGTLAIPQEGRQAMLDRANLQAAKPQPNLSSIRPELCVLKQAFMDDQIDEHIYAARQRALETRGSVAALPAATLDTTTALRMLDDFHGIAANASADQQRALIRQIFDELWLDHNQIIAVRPTPLYLPLAAAVVEWGGAIRLQKGLAITSCWCNNSCEKIGPTLDMLSATTNKEYL